jgi:chromosomal replication initiator protein
VRPSDFKHWIHPVTAAEIDVSAARITLAVPDEAHGKWLEDNYLDVIREALSEVARQDFDVSFRASPPLPDRPNRPPARVAHTAQPNLVARYRFDTFVGGPNNQFAMTAAKAVADRPGGQYNPLFLYGGVGLGKTHLLHAIGHAVMEQRPSANVVYVSSETFLNDLISAIRNDRMNLFRNHYRDQCDVLLIDDIQFIAGKDRTQQEFFHLFNALHGSHKQIVFTCDQVPATIPGLEERIKSRLGWGLICDIKPPGFETRVAILERKAEADGVLLPSEVAHFLADRITRNVRELEGALIRLGANSRIFGTPITLELAEELMSDLVQTVTRRLTPQSILNSVCDAFHASERELKGPRRHRHVTLPRQVAMFLIRELTDASLPAIGDIFGGRDHTTVISALKRIERLREADPALRHRIDTLRKRLEHD